MYYTIAHSKECTLTKCSNWNIQAILLGLSQKSAWKGPGAPAKPESSPAFSNHPPRYRRTCQGHPRAHQHHNSEGKHKSVPDKFFDVKLRTLIEIRGRLQIGELADVCLKLLHDAGRQRDVSQAAAK